MKMYLTKKKTTVIALSSVAPAYVVTGVGPKVTTWRGVIWPRDSLLLGGRGREPRKRGREGAGA
jgi:hypothetical protein